MPTSPAAASPPSGPDYELDDVVEASSPDQLKALGDELRRTILDLLHDRAATTTHLAETLGRPKGTIGYHLKVLEDAGLIRIVRTRPVRAMTEKYYGRVARTILVKAQGDDAARFPMLAEALAEARVLGPDDPLPMFTLRKVRVSEERAVEFAERLIALAEDFVSQPREGDIVYGLIAGVYPTDRPTLPVAGEPS
jgi:DNA-binding transcriptional ArsR family regulator